MNTNNIKKQDKLVSREEKIPKHKEKKSGTHSEIKKMINLDYHQP